MNDSPVPSTLPAYDIGELVRMLAAKEAMPSALTASGVVLDIPRFASKESDEFFFPLGPIGSEKYLVVRVNEGSAEDRAYARRALLESRGRSCVVSGMYTPKPDHINDIGVLTVVNPKSIYVR